MTATGRAGRIERLEERLRPSALPRRHRPRSAAFVATLFLAVSAPLSCASLGAEPGSGPADVPAILDADRPVLAASLDAAPAELASADLRLVAVTSGIDGFRVMAPEPVPLLAYLDSTRTVTAFVFERPADPEAKSAPPVRQLPDLADLARLLEVRDELSRTLLFAANEEEAERVREGSLRIPLWMTIAGAGHPERTLRFCRAFRACIVSTDPRTVHFSDRIREGGARVAIEAAGIGAGWPAESGPTAESGPSGVLGAALEGFADIIVTPEPGALASALFPK